MRGKWAMAMAMSVAVLLGGLAAAPEVAQASPGSTTTLSVSNHKTSPSTQKKNTSNKNTKKKNNKHTSPARSNDPRDNRDRGGLNASACSYPPVSAPAVSLGASTGSTQRGQRFMLSGKVMVNACGLGGLSVGIFISGTPDGPFTYGGSTHTKSNGEFWFKMTQPDTRYYEVMSAATSCFNSATSNVVTVYKGH